MLDDIQPKPTLAEIVEIRHPTDPRLDDAQFMNELVRWLNEPTGRGSYGIERQPPVGYMLWALSSVWQGDGPSGFIQGRYLGGYLHEAKGWASEIGAEATSAYLASAERELLSTGLLANGRLPKDDAARRELLSDIEDAFPELFTETVRAHWQQMTGELPGKIRAWIGVHLDEIEGAYPVDSAF